MPGQVDEGREALMQAVSLVACELGARPLVPLRVSLPAANATPMVVGRIKQVLARHPGQWRPVELHLFSAGRTVVLSLPFWVSPTVVAELEAVLGPEAMR